MTSRSLIAARITQLPPTGMRRYFDLALNQPDVISLGVGEPDFVTPESICEAGVASLKRGATKYTLLPGIPELRAAVSRHLKRLYGVSYDQNEEVLITVGTSEGMHAALTVLINPGDEVLVPEPAYLSYVPLVRLAGGTPVSIPVYVENRFQLTAGAIEETITARTKAIVLNYPNNPTGAVLERGAAIEVANTIRRHGLVVISDEVYDRLVYCVEHICIASLEGMKERTVLLGGFSKAYAMTGWRVGYAAGPAELIQAMLSVHQYTVMCAPAMAQIAALYALEYCEELVESMRAEYDRRRRLLVEGLHNLGLDCCEPQGAFFAFPSVRKTGLNDREFAERLLTEHRVVVLPGSIFGAAGAGFVRCSYSVSLQILEEALIRIARFLAQLNDRQ
jgi:aminotransferase